MAGELAGTVPHLDDAASFLGGGLVGPAWAAGLEHRDGGWWPRFDRDVMVRTIAAAVGPRWDEWDQVTCPTLVVRGGNGYMGAEEFARMSRRERVTTVDVPGGGHDVHLDSPDAVRAAITTFLASPTTWSARKGPADAADGPEVR